MIEISSTALSHEAEAAGADTAGCFGFGCAFETAPDSTEGPAELAAVPEILYTRLRTVVCSLPGIPTIGPSSDSPGTVETASLFFGWGLCSRFGAGG